MDLFNVLSMIGGLSLFLFGMSLMGQALEKRTGYKLRGILEKMTTNKLAGFATGCAVTAIIQSSSATTVMVVGFVNSGLMNLHQSINVIMGANVGTTITSWILSLSGISSKNMWIRLFKPTSFTPILAFLGIIMYTFSKSSKKKDTGTIFLGFATLMFGMETMSGAVSGLSQVPMFQELFIMFQNPFIGLIVGAILTAIIQSSSASVGILQALSVTGKVSFGAAVPIIMGQNIGTCVTAIISSVGANMNAKRTAVVHLFFNIIGSLVILSLYSVWKIVFSPKILNESVTGFDIAIIHTLFNLGCVILMMPNSELLEKLAIKIIPDRNKPEMREELDVRLLETPTLALEQCNKLSVIMANNAVSALANSLVAITRYSHEIAEKIREQETLCDHYEDIIGTYLVSLSTKTMNSSDSEESLVLLKTIGDFERISDHAVNILESAEEVRNKNINISEDALKELDILLNAIREILDLTIKCFSEKDNAYAQKIDPLEQVIDDLKENLRTRHIMRMQQGQCSIEAGFVWSDILTNLERTSDHCSNIAGSVIDMKNHNLNLHKTQQYSGNDLYNDAYISYSSKYSIS